MTNFDAFTTEYGQPVNPEKASPELLAEYKDIVPIQLIEFWERFGFASYADGLLWVVNPKQLEDVLSEWYPTKAKQARLIPVIRTAFGKIIYWHKNTFIQLDVHHNDSFESGDNAKLIFTFMLISKPAKQGILQESLFKKALKKFGPLQSDEMYSYKLALAMGGDNDLKNMAKMKMREQLSILAQIHGTE